MKRICIFCGSSFGSKPIYRESAEKLGQELARRDLELVYGGASVGLMGSMAKSCITAGGTVIGVIPEKLVNMGVSFDEISDLRVVSSMHERKALMSDLADAFIALPGGIGTSEEILEMFTWMQLGLHTKPMGLLNIDDFYSNMIEFLNHVVTEGFLRKEHLDQIIVEKEAEALLDKMARHQPIHLEKWFDIDANRA